MHIMSYRPYTRDNTDSTIIWVSSKRTQCDDQKYTLRNK